MKARGNTKVIIEKVGEIQNLIGEAKGGYLNDAGAARSRAEIVLLALEKAHELCIEITGMYDPL